MLGGEEMKVVRDGKDLRFVMEMINRRRQVRTGYKPKGFILHQLETLYGSRRVIGVNNRCGIIEKGSH